MIEIASKENLEKIRVPDGDESETGATSFPGSLTFAPSRSQETLGTSMENNKISVASKECVTNIAMFG